MMVEQIRTRSLFHLEMELRQAVHLVGDDGSTRLIYCSEGGRFEGERLRGRILPVTGDWVNLRDKDMDIDVRVQMETDDGASIFLNYSASQKLEELPTRVLVDGKPRLIGPDQFRAAPTFETSDPRYQWLNKTTVLGIGTRTRRGAICDFVELF